MPQPSHTFRSELVTEMPSLRALARRLVRDDEADDLAHEAIATALSQPTRPRSLGPWLRQVVRNEHRARVRSEVRRRQREERSTVPDPPPSLDDEVARSEIIDALREAIEELDEPYRAAIIARFFEDRTAAEIARSEDCPHATVRWRVQEGLRRTRRKMDERFDGRRQWLGNMAAFAGLPIAPPSTALTTGATTMNKLAILEALTVTAIAAGAATLVISSVSEVTAADPETEPASLSSNVASTPERPAIEPAPSDPAFALPSTDELVGAHDDSTVPAEAPECGGEDHGCAGPPIPADLLEDCFDVAMQGSAQPVNLTVYFGSTSDAGRIVERVEVVSPDGADLTSLGQCLSEGLVGSTLRVDGLADDTEALQMSLTGSADDGPPVVDSPRWATEAGARDPMQAIADLDLPRRGNENAKVSIVECAEFDCPFCDKARETMDRIRADYGDDVAIHWMHNPLPFHQTAGLAARAAYAAQQQGKFWEMHDLLFDFPKTRSPEGIVGLAEQIGLDLDRFSRDLESEATYEALEQQKSTCNGNGARGTPSFFIAGDLLIGAQPYDRFKTILDDELGS